MAAKIDASRKSYDLKHSKFFDVFPLAIAALLSGIEYCIIDFPAI